MIQRIQSVYLLLCSIVLGTNFWLPIAHSSSTAQKYFEDGILSVMDNQMSIASLAIASILAFVVIFLYKYRNWQIWLSIVGAGAIGLFFGSTGKTLSQSIDYSLSFGLFVPLLALVLLVLSILSIKKDEKLVKSMDRLR